MVSRSNIAAIALALLASAACTPNRGTNNAVDQANAEAAAAVGEVEHYSLPMYGLEPGRYNVEWKATARGVDHRGSFGFDAR